jgi:hypothetical protein
MRSLSIVLAFVLIPSAVHATSESACSLDAPWDASRESLAKNIAEPDFVPVPSVDDGRLFAAANRWVRARLEGDVATLERLTIPLPDQYRQVNRDWIASELGKLRVYEIRILTARVDSSNPLHVTVLSEVAVRIQGKCRVSTIGSTWVKLNAEWKMMPGGIYTR